MNDGPPPVPGGRSARSARPRARAREARRAARSGEAPPPAADPPPAETRDWLAEAEALTRAPAAERPPDGDGGRRPAPGPAPPAFAARGGPRGSGGRHWGRSCALVAVVVGCWESPGSRSRSSSRSRATATARWAWSIPQGASLGEIADLLESKGVVSSSSFFQLRARLAGRSGELKPGSYRLARDMSFVAVLDQLEQGLPPNVVQDHDPGGPLAPRGRAAGQAPARQLRQGDPPQPRPRPARLPGEGRQEPGGLPVPGRRYELKKGQPVRKLVDEQLSAFKRNFDKVDLRYARRKNLTPYDVLIIASLVEREAAVAKERPIIASVIYNRLHNDLRLDIDATVRFVTGNWTKPLQGVGAAEPEPVQHARPRRAAARADRQTRAWPRSRPRPTPPRPTTCSTWPPCAATAGTGSPPRTPSSSATWTSTTAQRDKRGGKSPTNC